MIIMSWNLFTTDDARGKTITVLSDITEPTRH